MKFVIFCVKDSATQQFGTPMFLFSAGQAVRSFTDEVNRSDAQNQIFQHPDDFELYSLGNFDSDVGAFDAGPPALVVRGKDVKVRS